MSQPSRHVDATQSGSDGTIGVEFVGDIAVIRMNRGENRFNDDFIKAFNSALDDVESNPGIRVLVTTGAGKFYSNGIDTNWLMLLLQDEPERIKKFLIDFRRLQERLLTFPMLTIAAINGHAFAGGAIMSLSHDYRVMTTDKGWWCLNEIHINLIFDTFLTAILRAKMSGGNLAVETIFQGRKLNGEQAQQLGIAQAVCSSDQLLAAAKQLAVHALPPNPALNRATLGSLKTRFYRPILDVDVVYDMTQFQPPTSRM